MNRALCAVLLIAVAGTSVIAHHSYGAYHRDQLIEVEGIVEAFDWISPHSFIRMKGDDGRGYVGEWLAAAALQRAGLEKDSLRPGDRIVMGGNPRRDIDESGLMNVRSIRRPADGWKWSR